MLSKYNNLESDYLRKILNYNLSTGMFTWREVSKYHKEKLNCRAGTIKNGRNNRDYEVIRINRKGYFSHRLAWLYVFGYTPKLIDHINGNPLDNRIHNLRAATQFQNAQNHISKPKKSGLPLGVSTSRNGYRARITAYNKIHSLGVFKTPEEASRAYNEARNQLHDAPVRKYIKC